MQQAKNTYGQNFAIRVQEIRTEASPFVRFNAARAYTLTHNRLSEAMRIFRGKLEMTSGGWAVKFPDGSHFHVTDAPLLQHLKKINENPVRHHVRRPTKRVEAVAHA